MKKNSPAMRTYKYLIVACLVSLIMSTFTSYLFYNKWNETEDRYIALQNEKNKLDQNFVQLKNSFDKVFSDLLVIRDENATVYTLYAVDSTRRYIARVYWNHYTRETFIDVLSLPAPDSTKQYHLWALSGSLALDAGVFKADPEPGIQRARPVVHAESWVATLEPKGDSSMFSPSNVYLLSKN